MTDKKSFLSNIKSKLKFKADKEENKHPGVFFDEKTGEDYMTNQMEYTLLATPYRKGRQGIPPIAVEYIGAAAFVLCGVQSIRNMKSIKMWADDIKGAIEKFFDDETLGAFSSDFVKEDDVEKEDPANYKEWHKQIKRYEDEIGKLADTIEDKSKKEAIKSGIDQCKKDLENLKQTVFNKKKPVIKEGIATKYYDLIYENIEKYRDILDQRHKAWEDGEYTPYEYGTLLEAEQNQNFSLKQEQRDFGREIYRRLFGTDAIKDNPYNRMFVLTLAMMNDVKKALVPGANFKTWQTILNDALMDRCNECTMDDMKKFRYILKLAKESWDKK